MKPAFVAAIALVAVVNFAPWGNAKQKTDQTTRTCDNEHPARRAAIFLLVQNEKEWAAGSNNPAQNNAPKRDEAAQWVLVVIAGVTALFICWQAWETRRAATASSNSFKTMESQRAMLEKSVAASEANADAAKANAAAAERSVELFIAKERARVAIQVDKLNLSPHTPGLSLFEADYKVFNYGPSPAFIVDADARLKISGSPEPPAHPPFVTMGLPPVVNPTVEGIKRSAICFDKVKLEQATIDSINRKQLFVHFYGFIKYRDISTKEETGFWETRFMYLWNVSNLKIPDGSPFAYWTRCGPPEANRET
jgi:hypothetical protein